MAQHIVNDPTVINDFVADDTAPAAPGSAADPSLAAGASDGAALVLGQLDQAAGDDATASLSEAQTVATMGPKGGGLSGDADHRQNGAVDGFGAQVTESDAAAPGTSQIWPPSAGSDLRFETPSTVADAGPFWLSGSEVSDRAIGAAQSAAGYPGIGTPDSTGGAGAAITAAAPYSPSNPFKATAAQVLAALNGSNLTYTGAGITVGVLSDSFNNLGGAAQDEASGALPAASQINVLKDLPSGGPDEGRAMMQIVHEIAPGAKLDFYTADVSEADFAAGIIALANAGCKVICDDINYQDEPFFQTGIVANAIQTVEQQGVTFVTCAGNFGTEGYQAAWNPIASTTYDGTTLTDTQNFGTAGSPNPVQTVTIGGNAVLPGGTIPFVLQWNQAWGTVSASTAKLALVVFSNGSLVGTFGITQPGNPYIRLTLPVGTYQIAIENLAPGNGNPGLIKDMLFANGSQIPFASLGGANTGTVVGHHTSPYAITVGAVDAGNTAGNGNGNSLQNEFFSSSGRGTQLWFNDDGSAVAGGPLALNPVAVSGIDDIATTLPLSDENGGLTDFFGTSAATPSIAGVVADMLQSNPNLTPTRVKNILEQSVTAFGDPNVAGAGLVNAAGAVQQAGRQLTFVGTLNVDHSFDPNWNDYTVITTPSTTQYFAAWVLTGTNSTTFPGANDELTITNNIQCVLIGREFDSVTLSRDLTDAADSLTITAGSSLTMNADLLLGSGAGNGGIALTANGAVSVGDNSFLTVLGGISISNNSTITLHAGSSRGSKLLVGSASVSLTGGGSIVLSDANLSRIEASAAGGTLDNVANTISGSGQVGFGTTDTGVALTLENEVGGTIDPSSAGSVLTINTANATLINKGLMRATNGGTLLLQTAIDSTGGVIQNLSGVLAVSTTVAAGTWVSSASNTINVVGDSTFDGSVNPVTIAGNPGFRGVVSVADNVFLTAVGNIINSGIITLHAGASRASRLLVHSGITSLSGGGSLVLNDVNLSRIEATGAGATLDNGNNTISGVGQIGFGNADTGVALTLTNEAGGTIDANVAGAVLTINTAGIPLINKGMIEATNGATLVVNSAINNTGGILFADGGDIDLSNATIAGGRLLTSANNAINITGDSTVDGSVNAPSNEENLSVADNVFLTVLGSVTNSGIIILHAGGSRASRLMVGSATVSLTGGGYVQLTDANLSRIETAMAGATLDNVNNVIFGVGQIGFGIGDTGVALTLKNEAGGTIDANVNGGALTINTGGVPLINKGLIEAANGATVVVNSTINGTGGGVIDALSGGIILSNATIVGGTLESTGANTISVTGDSTFDGSLSAPDNAGAVSVADNIFLTVLGSIINSGTITLHAGGSRASRLLIESATVSLTGGGSIVLSDANLSRIETTLTGATLDNVGDAISGSGQIGFGSADTGVALALKNEAGGTIDANVSGGVLTINTAAATLVNKGLIEATNGGTLVFLSAVDNTNGTIEATTGGTLSIQSAINNTGNVINALGGGITLSHATIAGGTLESGTLINVAGDSTLDGSGGPVSIASAMSVADNVFLTALGSITNNSTITLHAGGSRASRLLIGSATVSLTGGGSIVLSDANLSRIESILAGATLDNVGDAISGSGQIGFGNADTGLSLTLKNEAGGTIDANVSGGVLTINTGVTITNNGILEANGGSLVVNDAVTGSGSVLITGGGTASFAVNANFQQNVTFSGAGTLVLPEASASAGGYIGHIAGWGATDTVDITGLGWKSSYWVYASVVGNLSPLAVLDRANNNMAVAELVLQGQYIGRNFTVADDGHGGTQLTEHAAGTPPAPTAPTLSIGSDSGVKGDNVTDIATPVITGTGEAGDTVTLYDGATAVGGVAVNLDGSWSITSSRLGAGVHSLTAVETDALGGVSVASTALSLKIISAPDFNGDGTGLVLFRYDQNNPALGLFQGELVFADMTNGKVTGWGAATGGLGTLNAAGHGDVNGDGFSDVIVQDPNSGQVYFGLQPQHPNGNGGFTPTWVLGPDVPGFTVVGVGDIQHNGFADIVIEDAAGNIDYFDSQTGKLYDAEHGSFVASTPGWNVVGVGDINGDGFADIVIQNPNTGAIDYMNMAGGVFNPVTGFFAVGTTPGWDVKAVADLTGFGFADIVVQSRNPDPIHGTPAVYYGLQNGNFATGFATTELPAGWVVSGAVDILNNGHADVIVQQQSTGTTLYAQAAPIGAAETAVQWGLVTASIDSHFRVV